MSNQTNPEYSSLLIETIGEQALTPLQKKEIIAQELSNLIYVATLGNLPHWAFRLVSFLSVARIREVSSFQEAMTNGSEFIIFIQLIGIFILINYPKGSDRYHTIKNINNCAILRTRSPIWAGIRKVMISDSTRIAYAKIKRHIFK